MISILHDVINEESMCVCVIATTTTVQRITKNYKMVELTAFLASAFKSKIKKVVILFFSLTTNIMMLPRMAILSSYPSYTTSTFLSFFLSSFLCTGAPQAPVGTNKCTYGPSYCEFFHCVCVLWLFFSFLFFFLLPNLFCFKTQGAPARPTPTSAVCSRCARPRASSRAPPPPLPLSSPRSSAPTSAPMALPTVSFCLIICFELFGNLSFKVNFISLYLFIYLFVYLYINKGAPTRTTPTSAVLLLFARPKVC